MGLFDITYDPDNKLNPYGLLDPTYPCMPAVDPAKYPFPASVPTMRRQRDSAYDQGIDLGDGKAPNTRALGTRVKGKK